MSKAKYDWAKMKAEFIGSSYVQAKLFLQEVHGIDVTRSGQALKKVRGWASDKRALMEEAKQKAINNIKNNIVKMYTPSVEELSKMHESVLSLYKVALAGLYESCVDAVTGKPTLIPDTKTLGDIWKVIKVEKGEATDFSGMTVSISEEDKKLLDKVLSDNL